MRHILLLSIVFVVLAFLLKLRVEFSQMTPHPSVSSAGNLPAQPVETQDSTHEWLMAILQSWDYEKFEEHIHPDLKQKVPAEGLRTLFQGIASRLGPLRTHGKIEGGRRLPWLAALTGLESTYRVRAAYAKGEALVEARILYERGRPWIRELSIQSEAMEKVRSAAEKAYRSGDFDAGLFYYELAL